MNTGLLDKNGTPIRLGDRTRLILEDGEIREFEVQLKSVTRTVKCHQDFDDDYSRVNITGVVFSWNGYDLFPCVDKSGISDVSKMEVIQSSINESVEMVEYDGEPVPKELCSIDREGGADEFYGCGACFVCEGHLECSECVVDKMFKHYAKLTGQEVN